MANQPEFLIGNPGSNGPLFSILGTDGISSSSLIIDVNNILTFTGSIPVSMSYSITAITASTAATSSLALISNTASYVNFTAIANTPTLVSSSAQVSYLQITNVPANIVSSSAQVSYTAITNVPANIVSSSAQTINFLSGSSVVSSSNQVAFILPAGTVSSSAQVLGGSGVISSSLQFPTNAVFNVGSITASSIMVTTLVATTISSSVDYSSGSNIFGNSLSSTQQFTGSVSITGSLTVNGPINAGNFIIQGTASYSTSASYTKSSSYSVSSDTASYVTWTNVANKPAGIVSSSAQILVDLQTSGIISSSAQFSATDVFNVGQVTASFFGTLTGTASWAQNSRTASYVAWSNIASIPAGIVSSSAQTVIGLQGTSIISSSAQTLISLQSSGIYSSSAQLPAGLISGSSQVTMSYAATASYINPNSITAVGYIQMIRTSSFTSNGASTFQRVLFEQNAISDATDWTFNNGVATCSQAGTYTVDGAFFCQKISGTAAIAGVRLVHSGSVGGSREISGSYSGFTFSSNNVVQPLSVNVTDTFNVNDTLEAQLAGNAVSIQIIQPPTVGSPVTRPSINIRIHGA